MDAPFSFFCNFFFFLGETIVVFEYLVAITLLSFSLYFFCEFKIFHQSDHHGDNKQTFP